jgi:hypothetical protein
VGCQEAGVLDEMLTFVDTPRDESPGGLAVDFGLGVRKYLLPGGIETRGHGGPRVATSVSSTTCPYGVSPSRG